MAELAVEHAGVRAAPRELAIAAVPAVGAFAAVAGPAAAQGAYFPTSWGWTAMGLFAAAGAAIGIRRRLAFGRLEAAMVVAVVALVGWIAASMLWSQSKPDSMLETERAIVYLGIVVAVLAIVRVRSLSSFFGGIVAGTGLIGAYGLASRLLVNHPGVRPFGGRLSDPIGYWNALGIFAAIGLVVAVGVGARASRAVTRGLAGGAVVVLAATLYLTFSRGSTWSLVAGLAAAVVFEKRRLQLVTTLLLVAPGAAVAVLLLSRSHDLTSSSPPPVGTTTTHYGLAAILLALAAGTGLAVSGAALVERRFSFPPRLRTAYAAAILAAVAVGLLGGFAHYGGPSKIAHRAWASFRGPLESSNDLNNRLFSLSNNYRIVAWKAAWHDYKAHPMLGSGAGSFEQYWLQTRSTSEQIRDAHNLYLETLAELGPVGLGLLAIVLGLPLVAAVRARAKPFTAVALGGYLAFLVHAGGDWDWEVPAVTGTALLLGAGLLVSARRSSERPVSPYLRGTGLAIALAGAALAVVGFVGNNALSSANTAAASQNWAKAESEARKAISWAPWSDDPWRVLGEAQVGAHDFAAAKASFAHAARVNPRNWLNWYDLGTVTRGVAQRRAYGQAALLNPLDPGIAVLRQLGVLPRSA